VNASASTAAALTLAKDDDQERRVRLVLLGKGAVLAHRFERPLAAELDEKRQPPRADVVCRFSRALR
jgi:hypothetical protein